MKKKRVYLSSPISKGDQAYNFYSACAMQEQLMLEFIRGAYGRQRLSGRTLEQT